jgi:hypothetical protein
MNLLLSLSKKIKKYLNIKFEYRFRSTQLSYNRPSDFHVYMVQIIWTKSARITTNSALSTAATP